MAPTLVPGMLRVTNVTLTLTRRQVITLMAHELQHGSDCQRTSADRAAEWWPDGRCLMDWVRTKVRQHPHLLDTDGVQMVAYLVRTAAQHLASLYPEAGVPAT